jgi:AcrR family transcriptional regulator
VAGKEKSYSQKKVITQVKNTELVEQKHHQIVEAASKLFSEKGYHKTSLRDISRESGINLSYIYKYISKKDDILYLFYQYISQKLSGFFTKSENQEFENPVAELKAFIRAMFEGIRNIKGEALTMYTESRHLEKDSLGIVLAEEAKTVKFIEKLIQRGMDQGYFQVEESFMAANIIAYMIPFYPLRGWNFRDRYSFDQFIELTTDFILNSLNVEEEHK